MTHKCKRCNEEKALEAFSLNNRGNPRGKCKACVNEYSKQFRTDKQKSRLSYRVTQSVYKSCPVYFKVCAISGKLFTSKRPHAKYSKEVTKEVSKLFNLKYQHIRQNTKALLFQCKHCGVSFLSEHKDKRKKFCSYRCSKKYYAKDRKVKTRQGHRRMNPLTVLERDNWTCYICGCFTPKEFRGTLSDNAPEVDHIIPLSKGGEHALSNVRCCCRKCNNRKSNTLLTPVSIIVAGGG